MSPVPAVGSATPSLAPGTRLGPYVIEAAIGAGGMGEVYRARDSRLGRTVAIKVLPPHLAADTDRRHRFEREARAVAALEHPHICVLHDLGSEEGVDYLVMEHLEGQTLATRLKRGPLKRGEALRVATQIAEALDAAHRRGIVHRDLKPGNVMLAKSGVKLLDFGLAKLRAPRAEALSELPTASGPSTGSGRVVGTVPYMSPEQVEGKEADARSDLWALGVVLYEMLTGRRAFEGESAPSVMAAILEREPPPLSTRDPLAPPALDRLVRRCLAKDPDRRWQSARDVADELAWVAETDAAQAGRRIGAWTGRRVGTAMAAVGVILLAIGLGFGAWLKRGSTPAPGPVTRTLVSVEPAEAFGGQSFLGQGIGGIRTSLALSPDGRTLVFVGRQGGSDAAAASAGRGGPQTRHLYVRRLDEPRASRVPGTEGAENPFFSPAGEWVGFWARGHLWKVALRGGPPVSLCALASAPHGASWGALGRIVVGRGNDGLWAVSDAGGEPTPLTTLGRDERSHRLPHVLPGGDAVVFTAMRDPLVWANARVVAQSLRSGERTVLVEGGADARYVPTGHLVFLRLGSLMAVPFDAGRLAVKGTVVGLAEGIAQAAYIDTADDSDSGAGQFSVAASGALAFVQGAPPTLSRASLARVDLRGSVTPLTAPQRGFISIRFAPDGRRAAVHVRQEGGYALWLVDLERGTLALLEPGWFPTWARNGRELAFARYGEGLFRRPPDGSGPAVLLLKEPGYSAPASWTPDGSHVAFVRVPAAGSAGTEDILWLDTERAASTAEPLVVTPFNERNPEFSADGRWLAYASEESGREEVYIQAHPAGIPRVQVSKEGGGGPAWSPDGRVLFYVALLPTRPIVHMMAVPVAKTPSLAVGPARVLFEFDASRLNMTCAPVRCYDVAPDGRGFLTPYTPEPPVAPTVTHVNLVLNWAEELKARAPAGR